jgi:signal transduction histidine kinase
MTTTADVAELALDALPQAVFVADVSAGRGRNLYVNTAYTRLCGYSAAEALAPSFDAASIFADLHVLEEPPAEGKKLRVEVLKRDGGRTAALLTLRATTGNDGKLRIVGIVGESPGADRGTDWSESLSPAGDRAAPDEIRDALLSALSHELRSPLNACTLWLDVLATAPPGEGLRKAVDALKRNLGRQARAVSSIGDAAKLSSGALELRPERIDLGALLERSLEAWHLLAAAKQQTLEWSNSVATAPVAVDPDRLIRVLTDLVDNASDRTPSGGRLSLTLDEDEDGRFVVAIRDGGAPLTAEAAGQLFEPLWRSASARGDSRRRIGLSIAVDLVASLGGTLRVSTAGAATTFSLALARSPLVAVS